MPDAVILCDRSFLYEKLFEEAGADVQFIKPEMLCSPFLPRFRALIIPTGFANQQYSRALRNLRACKEGIENFVRSGGVIVVFGPLVPEHDYDWLPIAIRYRGEYTEAAQINFSCEGAPLCSDSGDCDGYLEPSEGIEVLARDSSGRPVLCTGRYGEGMIFITSIHEFPSADFVRYVISMGKPSKII
ncbi:MAG: hypothetical protein H5T42_03655 [Methanothrix sp.]|uniref:hypothetical protein n=1 Tax=Methanothrix sp. TaxID=90426 RepID=UPI00198EE925|nr:hypothetical protein [Methanothrix sp.]MBC7079551.1 hypothetical protein [Methanothrix sp.]NPU87522.1 hypothetical protein [Methanothrix sp.]